MMDETIINSAPKKVTYAPQPIDILVNPLAPTGSTIEKDKTEMTAIHPPYKANFNLFFVTPYKLRRLPNTHKTPIDTSSNCLK
jgi:hypothetical protein